MRKILVTLWALMGVLSVLAQDAMRQVRITTTAAFDGITVALFDTDGKMVTAGKTPYEVTLKAGCDYQYHIRHIDCLPDSGYLHIDDEVTELRVPVRLYQRTIDWQVMPEDADFRLKPIKGKGDAYGGKTQGQSVVNGRDYVLTIRKSDYRRFHQVLHLGNDSTIIVNRVLHHCPRRVILAFNAGISTRGSLPMGITVAYGGAHGFYGRYMQTWTDRADGEDFEADDLIDVLANPYSDQAAEYLSVVAGYQYYTPMGLYLQMGAGYGVLDFNWLSADDGKRHRFAPDNMAGAVVDLGVGYAFGRVYVGGALQSLVGGKKTFTPVCGLINLGICL